MTFGVAEFVAVTGVRDPSAITTLGGVRVDMPSPLDARADCLAGEMADHRTLALVGLASRAAARCHELSSAERWRLAIAHALSTGRSPLVIDGTIPFASQAELVTLALGLRHAGITVYVVTNDDRLAGSADRVVSASPGRSTAGPPSASTLDRARIIHELLRSVT
jgi:ABC-type lipoprotein export system ATPase subunit